MSTEADIVTPETLRALVTSDHKRGCQGRKYGCSCGYDENKDRLIEHAADMMDNLRADLRDAQIDCVKLRAERDRAVLRGKTLRCAGTLMANAMFNLSQRGEMTDYMRVQMREMQQGWDRAAAVFATDRETL